MKKSIADKWIAELLSGKHKQGNRLLHTRNDEFCCLGVACKMIGAKGFLVHNMLCYRYTMGDGNGGDSAVLSDDIMEALTMKTACGNVKLTKKEVKYLNNKYNNIYDTYADNQEGTDLTRLNDHGVSFSDIAGIIKKHYKEL